VIDARPSMDQTLMSVAELMAQRGTCSRATVGVVIARDGRPLATGYNGAPRGMAHCLHPPGEVSAERDVEAPTCRVAVHAEANAVAFAARYGITLDGATLYTTLSPCIPCAQLIVNAGIRTVYVRERYRDLGGVRLLNEANVLVFTYDASLAEFGWFRDSGVVTPR
jgi:dCMP deaminase